MNKGKNKRWKHSNKAIFNLGYHIIFCPKYRKKILVGEIETELKKLFLEKAVELKIEIENLEIMPDHVHLFIKPLTPTDAPHYLIGQLKGYTSNLLRRKFINLRKLPSLWTRSYFIESVGIISEESIKKYIENQKNV